MSNLESLITSFSEGTPTEQHESLRKIMALRKHHDAIKDVRFIDGIDRLFDTIPNQNLSDLDRLLSVATIGRIYSTIKGQRKSLLSRLEAALVTSLPDPFFLSEADDRAYVGQVCSIVLPDWIVDYASHAVIYEETGEKARQEFFLALLAASNSFEEAIDPLINLLNEWEPDTEEPGNTIARRVRRLLTTFRNGIAETLPFPGLAPGLKLAELVKTSFAYVDLPKDKTALFETVEEVAGVVHELVRLRFSFASEPSTYFALKSMKALLTKDQWEGVANKSRMMNMVVQDITEAILILGRQGIIDSSLADQLSIAAGSRDKARQQMAALAKQPGVSSEIRNWLMHGKLEKPDENVMEKAESQALSDDGQLADLLVDALRFRDVEGLSENVLPEIEILNPDIAREVKRLSNYGLGLCDAIEAIAKRRSLKVRGKPGDTEDYAPLEHEVVGKVVGTRTVRIIRPVVEQFRQDGIHVVIRKGLTESI
jgi:hypothetical protein